MAGQPDPSTEPYAVLGVSPDATPEQIARAYRRLAKRLHPDRAGAQSAAHMAQLNAAYELLRDGLVDLQRERLRAGAAGPQPAGPPAPGHWLDAGVRRRLGRELVAALEPGEAVLHIADAATWDSHEVRLAVTDRRLLWLRDDAITDRVRSQPHARTTAVEVRRRGRLRRTAELRVTTDQGRRLGFAELAPEVATALSTTLGGLVFQAPP